jgi:hypothetical protein
MLPRNDNQSGGLLGDLDPQSRAMVALALISKFNNNNRGAQSGFGDIFSMMAQAQQMKMQQANQALAQQRFGLEQKDFDKRQQVYDAQMKAAQEKAQQDAEIQKKRTQFGQNFRDYQPQAVQPDPVVAEYETPQVPMTQDDQSSNGVGMPQSFSNAAAQAMPNPTQGQPFLIPTQGYLNNLFQATDQARSQPPIWNYAKDPRVREQSALLAEIGDNANAISNATQGGRFIMDGTAYTGAGSPFAKSGADSPENKKANASIEQNLSHGYMQDSQQFQDMTNTFGRFNAASDTLQQSIVNKKPNNAAAISVIYNFMRLQNPNIRLNEGTIATATNAPGIEQRIINMYNAAAKGQAISPRDLNDIITTGKNVFQSAVDNQQHVIDHYKKASMNYGLNPDNVVTDYYKPKDTQNSAQSNQQSNQQQGGMLMIRKPNGEIGRIPASNLNEALQLGGKRI